jgi:hypothetical protein
MARSIAGAAICRSLPGISCDLLDLAKGLMPVGNLVAQSWLLLVLIVVIGDCKMNLRVEKDSASTVGVSRSSPKKCKTKACLLNNMNPIVFITSIFLRLISVIPKIGSNSRGR